MTLKSLALAAVILVVGAVPALALTAEATTEVNVRACGSTECRVLDVLGEGEEVEVEYCEDEWCAVSRRGPDGFVNANYLARASDDDDDYYDDDFDDRIYFERRYPRRFFRDYDDRLGVCFGNRRARFCVID